MKRLSLVLMSVALVLGMAQCKKNNEVITSGVADGTRTITLKVNDNGSKISVNPSTGAVGFTKGDVIYAAYNGKYAGTLTHDGTDFTGTVTTSAASGAKLTFYFMGNKTPTETLSTTTTSLTVNIFDQTESYPVISVGLSNETYPQEGDVYTATLNNQCALVKFNVTTSSAYAPTIIAGVNDKVSVTFAAGAIGEYEYSQHRGAVKVAGGSGERWAILLPQDAAGIGVAYSGDLRYNGTHGMIPVIMENGYLTAGVDVNVSNALSGFTVAAGTVRFFAPGNLQYIGSATTPYWKFADNQYDIIGASQGTASATVDRDLFGWGTSGYNGKNPWMTSTTETDYGPSGTTNLTGENADYDWGVYNSSSITNGYGRSWQLLTWGYVISNRTGCSTINGIENARYGICTVADIYGVMVFPNEYTWPTSVELANAANINNGSYDAIIGTYTPAQWTLLEANGAVFLPAAGSREGSSMSRINDYGRYWSYTCFNESTAYCLTFQASSGNINTITPVGRCIGRSVRLVCE